MLAFESATGEMMLRSRVIQALTDVAGPDGKTASGPWASSPSAAAHTARASRHADSQRTPASRTLLGIAETTKRPSFAHPS